jgi:hypothetical protein
MTREDIKKAFPEATDDQIKGLLDIHTADIGKALKKQEKQITDLTGERDGLQEQLTKANEALASFEGVDPAKLKEEVEKYKKAAKDAEADFKSRMTQRDQRDWLKGKMDEYDVKSPYARAQLISEIMSEESGLKWKDGAFFGFDDYMKSAKEKDASLYLTAEEKEAAAKQKELEGNAPKFTGPANNGSNNGGNKFVPPRIF